MLEALGTGGAKASFSQASTSEMVGKIQVVPRVEDAPFHPRSPYGVAKLFGYWATSTTAKPTAFSPDRASGSVRSHPCAALSL